MMGTQEHRREQRDRWRKLSPYHRHLLMSDRPDDLEREMTYRAEALADMVAEYGPQQWDATIAILAEGEAKEVDRPTFADGEPDGLGFREIGDELGLSHTRVRQILLTGLRKLRDLPLVQEMCGVEDRVEFDAATIEAALKRAHMTEATDTEEGERS